MKDGAKVEERELGDEEQEEGKHERHDGLD